MTLVVFLVCFLTLLGVVFRPRAFVYAVFLLGPFPYVAVLRYPSTATPLGEIHINALIVFAILMASLVGLTLNLRRLGRPMASTWMFVVFFAFAIASIAWASDLSMALRMLMKLITPWVFMLYVAATMDRIGADSMLRAVLISGVVYIGVSLVAWGMGWTEAGYFGLPGTARAVSSGHALAAFGVAFAELIAQPSAWRMLLAALIGGAVLAGFTRITIAGMFGSASVILFLKTRGLTKIALPVIGAAGLLALFTFVDVFRERMFLENAERMSFESVLADPGGAVTAISGSGRYRGWQSAIDHLITPSPVVGSGIGSAQRFFYGPSGSGISAVHSEVLRLLCDTGWVGLALFVLAWIQLFWAMVRRRNLQGRAVELPLAAISSAAGYIIFLLTDNGFDYVGQIGVFVYGLAGATLGVALTERVQSDAPRKLLDEPARQWRIAGPAPSGVRP